MNILSDEQHQMLTFVGACNRYDYNPTGEQVMLWMQNPQPAGAEYRTVEVPPVPNPMSTLIPTSISDAILSSDAVRALGAAALARSTDMQEALDSAVGRMVTRMQAEHASLAWSSIMKVATTKRELVKEAEGALDHLIRLTWLQQVPRGEDVGLRLTDLGQALLRDRDQELIEDDVAVSVVVLSAADPLAYARLVGHLAEAGPGLLVDPYLKIDQLHMIVNRTSLTRLLVLANSRTTGALAAMETYLSGLAQSGPGLARRVEVRKSTEVHDRYLLADDGSVMSLGSSLVGVGRKTTVLTPLASPASAVAALRDEYEQMWERAELVGPQPTEHDDPREASS